MALQVSYATAPPTVGNMAVGFDVLGHALNAQGDQVRATRTTDTGVMMGSVFGCVDRLPGDPAKNTAGAGVIALLRSQRADFGIRLDVYKGVALGSGMGGSASSAVASVVAANALLDQPLPLASLMPFALAGEEVASGCVHGDNVAPCLMGGIVFISPREPSHWFSVPVPDGLHCVLVRPDMRLDTAAGRSLLKEHVSLYDAVTQTSHFARLLGACFNNDTDALRGALCDVLVEPQRSGQVSGFAQIRDAALGANALGFSLSGSGPSMVAWVHERDLAEVRARVTEVMDALYPDAFQSVVSKVDAPGACLIGPEDWLGDA